MKSLKIFLSIFLFLSSLSVFGQYDPSKINKKAIADYNAALEKAQDGHFDLALGLLQQAIEKAPEYVDAYLSMAGIFGQLKNYEQSTLWYEKAFSLDSTYTADYLLPYSINLAGLGQFEKALTHINLLLARQTLGTTTRKAAEYRKKTFLFAIDFSKNHAEDHYVFAPKNLGDGVNSKESEYFPSLPIDGKELIFTRRLNNFNEDFFISEKNFTRRQLVGFYRLQQTRWLWQLRPLYILPDQ